MGIPRPLEILVAIGGLIGVSPILIISALLTKLSSPGPILFRQKRVGKSGKNFTIYKFRTMRIMESGPLVTASSDQRITAIGRILRKSKCDELPGLWNVIKGDMSFVGPRPEVPQMVDLNNPIWQEILQVRPGITDPVTLKLRNEEQLLAQVNDKEEFYRLTLQPYKLKGYSKYVKERSFQTDLRIIFQTIKAVIKPSIAPPPTLEEIIKNSI